MNPTASQQTTQKDYFDLEEPLRDLTHMAGIAHDLAYELLEVERPKKDDEYVVLRLLPRQYEQLFFAIDNVYDRAKDVEKLYHK